MSARCFLAYAHMAPATILWAVSTAPVTKALPWMPKRGTAQVGALPTWWSLGYTCRNLWEGSPNSLNICTYVLCDLKLLITLGCREPCLYGGLNKMIFERRFPALFLCSPEALLLPRLSSVSWGSCVSPHVYSDQTHVLFYLTPCVCTHRPLAYMSLFPQTSMNVIPPLTSAPRVPVSTPQAALSVTASPVSPVALS